MRRTNIWLRCNRRLRFDAMKSFLAALVFSVCLVPPGWASAGDVAIIVNHENPVADLTFQELVELFRAGKPYWERWDHGEQRVYLVMQQAGTFEKKVVLKHIYKTDDEGLKRFWVTQIFNGKVSKYPAVLGSNESVVKFVEKVPTAVGYVDAAYADQRVKVLKVDGVLPGESGYRLSDGMRR